MLYSYKGGYPGIAPSRIRLPDGSTRTDPSTFTTELLEHCGYKEVSEKPELTQGNDVIEWNGIDWVQRPYTENEKQEIHRNKIVAVKNEARRRILDLYPEWKQSNMTARAVELQDIWRLKQSWSTSEQQEASALKQAWAWIKDIRAKSDVLEAMDPIPDDYTDDKYWNV